MTAQAQTKPSTVANLAALRALRDLEQAWAYYTPERDDTATAENDEPSGPFDYAEAA